MIQISTEFGFKNTPKSGTAIRMSFGNQTPKVLLGFDVGGTKCAVIIGESTQGCCRILNRRWFRTEDNPETNLQRMESMADEMIQNLGISAITSVGISCGGPLDRKNGRILSPPNLPRWDDIHIVSRFERTFQVPAHLENDANACALAEWRWGAGKGTKNMVFLTFGTGMGAGLILDGKLYSGTNDLAGEIGHVRIAEDGPICYGKSGSFEGYCSGAGISKMAADRKILCGAPSTSDVFDAAAAGNQGAIEVISSAAKALGRGVALLVDILNPELVVIGSIFHRQELFLRKAMQSELEAEALKDALKVCRIVPSMLAEEIGDYAALSTAEIGLSSQWQ